PTQLAACVRRMVAHLAAAIVRGLALVHHQIVGDSPFDGRARMARCVKHGISRALSRLWPFKCVLYTQRFRFAASPSFPWQKQEKPLKEVDFLGATRKRARIGGQHAQLRRDYHWHRTVRARLSASISGSR